MKARLFSRQLKYKNKIKIKTLSNNFDFIIIQIGENGTIENQDAVDFAAKTHELQTIIEKQVGKINMNSLLFFQLPLAVSSPLA